MDVPRFMDNREGVAEALEQAAVLMLRHLTDRQGLGVTASSVLARLEREGPVRLTALAAAESISQPSMSQLVQRLEGQGLVTRVSDPDDGRAALVAVAAAGRELLADLRWARRARLADLLTTLSPEDEAALALAMHVAGPVIQRLIHNATRGSAQPQAPPPFATA
jgi:DNA-binding MarR family transcriptional regulator